jgi:protein-tyrosine phosphatase
MGIFRAKAARLGLDVTSDSAGFEGYHMGQKADPRSILTALHHGIDITGHTARKFRTSDFDQFDRIYVMDDVNYNDVMSKARNETDRQKVDFIMNLSRPGSNDSVPDPYYGGKDGFENVFTMLDAACDLLVKDLASRKVKTDSHGS